MLPLTAQNLHLRHAAPIRNTSKRAPLVALVAQRAHALLKENNADNVQNNLKVGWAEIGVSSTIIFELSNSEKCRHPFLK